ncbi:uncharacterized protein L201_004561 [Kwoniella dendrophila CBS 6074]|uniref:VASt domain-containing protein n=1 Tax=Kwoniella dendrophila CBS 6074 TaxID=1295534 RepID=A0AAX4JW11_9TREE
MEEPVPPAATVSSPAELALEGKAPNDIETRSRGLSVGTTYSTANNSLSPSSTNQSSSSSFVSTVSTKASDSNLNQRQNEFEKNFTKKIEEEPITAFGADSVEYENFVLPDDHMTILATQAADLQAAILVHGRICLTRYHVCFRSNIIGIITMKVHALSNITSVKKGTTAKWIQNAIYLKVLEVDEDGQEVERDYNYGSLRFRDMLYDSVMECWKIRAPQRYEEFMKKEAIENGEELDDGDDEEDDVGVTSADGTTAPAIKKTSGSGEHYQELALNVKVPLELDQVYNLLYHNRDFTTDFYTNEKKLTELKISQWEDEPGTGNKRRTLNYVMHMNNTIGPKSSNCNGIENIVIADPEKAYEIVSETQTPDIPSGKSFKIRTRTCLTHDSLHHKQATKIHCTTQVDWSASSMLKSTITPAVIKGQKEHHRQLLEFMTNWVKQHPDDFKGVDSSQVEVKHETEVEHRPEMDTVNEKVGKTIMGHAREIPENPVMLVITVMFAVLLFLYIK